MSNKDSSNEVHVLHIIGRLISGGVEHRTLDLIKYSQDSDIVHHVCLTSGIKGTLDSEYEKYGARLHYLRINSPMFWLRFIQLARKESINVVHSNIHYASGIIMALSKIAGVENRITHFRSDGVIESSNKRREIQDKSFKFLINLFSTRIIGLTPQNLTIAWKKKWHLDPRCSVISNGVIAHTIDTLPAVSLLKFENKTIILHPGRANLPTKNREKAITVFSEYLKHNHNAVLVFVGRDGNNNAQSAENLERWHNLALEYGVQKNVFFLGHRDNISEFYFGSDILLFTSTKEGLPGVLLEALSAGLPVLSSDVPGAKFIAESCKNITTLSPDSSDSQWSEELKKLPIKLSNEVRKSNMAEFQQSDFTIENAVQNYSNLWHS